MNLENLISKLSDKYTRNSNLDLFSSMDCVGDYNVNDYIKHIEFSDEGYRRVQLHREDEFEIVLICWGPKQGSQYHLHSSNGCIMKILQGTLTEERRKSNVKVESFEHQSGEVAYMCNDLGEHKVYNCTNENAVSLHIYAPAGFVCQGVDATESVESY